MKAVTDRERAIRELDAWANPPTGGMGAGLHCEMWPRLSPSARKELQRLVKMLKTKEEER